MTYGELQKDLNDGKVSKATIKISVDRYETIYHDLSRAVLKKLISSAFKKDEVTADSRCIWGIVPDSSEVDGPYHVKLNF